MNSHSQCNFPKVSIVIPVYNGANYIAQAIESALIQSYKNIEIIVVNDGSEDGGATESAVSFFKNQVRYFYKPNGGVASALNFGISKMEGELFSWLSHDDVYSPEKIEYEVKAYLAGGRSCIIYSDFHVIDSNASRLHSHRLPQNIGSGMRCFLTVSNALHGCTLLIPKAYITDIGGFNVSLKMTQDYDLWFRLAAKHAFVHVPEPLVSVRYHSEQLTSRSRGAIYEQDALYAGFVAQLSESEICEFTGMDLLGFYLLLFRRFHAGRLYNSREMVRKLILKELSGAAILRFAWSVFVLAPLLRVRVTTRQFLFQQNSGRLGRLFFLVVRALLVRR